jgi:hemolysin III
MSPPPAGRARLADLAVHAVGVPLGLAGAAVLIVQVARAPESDSLTLAAVGLYAAGLVGMLSVSAAYNLTRAPGLRGWLRRFDHAGIYVMIAGTYTPFMLVKIGGGWGAGFAAFVWAVALAGAAIKLIAPGRLERTSIVLYLLLGWSVVMTLESLIRAVDPTSLWLLLAGGLVYTAGVGLYLWTRFVYHRAAWHAFVLLAAILHYIAVARSTLSGAGGA